MARKSEAAKQRGREATKAWKAKNATTVAAYQRGWNARNRVHNTERMRTYVENNYATLTERRRQRAVKNPVVYVAKTLVGGVVTRSRRKGLVCDPELRSVEWVAAWLTKAPNCQCCGVAFDFTPLIGRSSASASIDRFDPTVGYTKANSKLICYDCNALKRDASLAKVERLAAWMRSVHEETLDQANYLKRAIMEIYNGSR